MFRGFDANLIAYNFDKVDDGLYRISLPEIDDIYYIHDKYKIKTIIDFIDTTTKTKEDEHAKELGIEYIHLPWRAYLPDSIRKNYYITIIDKFLEIVTKNENKPILVHCFHGRERTGLLVAIYKMIVHNYDYKEALQDMTNYGFKPWKHYDLKLYLKYFDKKHKNNYRLKYNWHL